MGGAATKKLTLTLALLLATGLLPALMTGAQDEPLFHVIPNNNLNLRACGSLDCAVVDQIQAGIRLPVYAVEGDWYQVRSKGRFLWLAGWLTTRAPDKVLETKDAPLFQVTTNYKLIPRSCASTQCEKVGQVAAGTEVSVYAVEDGWYQVLVDGELVWLAGWLTTGAPSPTLWPTRPPRPTRTPTPEWMLRADRIYQDRITGCVVLVDSEGFDDDLNIILVGDQREDVYVDVFRRGEWKPLRVTGRFRDIARSNEPIIWQYYSEDQVTRYSWYQLRIELDERFSLLEWNTRSGNQDIFVICNDPAPRPTRTPRPTVTQRVTATPRPTRTLRPTSTPLPTPTRSPSLTKSQIHLDAQDNVCLTVSALRIDLGNFWSDLREANHPGSSIDPGEHVKMSASVQLQRFRENLPVSWPLESTTARDLEHLIDSGALDYPSPGFYTSNLYAFYMMTARVAPDMNVLLSGLSLSPVGGSSFPVLTPGERRCRPAVERQFHYLLERDTGKFPAAVFDACFADFFETYIHYRFNMTENATETTRSIARGFAEVARAAVAEGRSIGRLVEDCS